MMKKILFIYFLCLFFIYFFFQNYSIRRYNFTWSEKISFFYYFIFPQKKKKVIFPKAQMGKHRVESIDKANQYNKRFVWFEVDIHFCKDKKIFIQSHDYECNGIELSDFLLKINNKDKLYFWFDFKNYSKDISQDSIKAMDKIVNQFKFKNRIFIESYDTKFIKNYSKAGYYTIYLIKAKNKFAISRVVETFAPTALSAPYNFFDFLSQKFSDQELFFWTNGLKTEKDKKIILAMKKYKKTKVILLDYEFPF